MGGYSTRYSGDSGWFTWHIDNVCGLNGGRLVGDRCIGDVIGRINRKRHRIPNSSIIH